VRRKHRSARAEAYRFILCHLRFGTQHRYYVKPKYERFCDGDRTVKWFDPTKGYGFIQPKDGSGKDVFVHISVVERAGLSTLNEGQVVEYEIVENRGKSSAENFKVAR
jgi:cold shock protein